MPVYQRILPHLDLPGNQKITALFCPFASFCQLAIIICHHRFRVMVRGALSVLIISPWRWNTPCYKQLFTNEHHLCDKIMPISPHIHPNNALIRNVSCTRCTNNSRIRRIISCCFSSQRSAGKGDFLLIIADFSIRKACVS